MRLELMTAGPLARRKVSYTLGKAVASWPAIFLTNDLGSMLAPGSRLLQKCRTAQECRISCNLLSVSASNCLGPSSASHATIDVFPVPGDPTVIRNLSDSSTSQ